MKRILLSICFLAIGLWASAGDMSNSIELTQLYIIGDATPYSWDLGKTPDMQKIDEGVFRWSGKLYRLVRSLSFSIRESFISIS